MSGGTAHWSAATPDRVVTMPRPPSTNRLWIRAPGKPRVRSPEYRAWIFSAGWDVRRQLIGIPPIDCRFNVVIEVPISRRDSGNFEKATMDLCEIVGLVTNDGNAHEINIRPTAREDVMVAIWCLPEMGAVRRAAKPRGAKGADGRRDISRRAVKMRPGMTWKLPA
jgi:Holliday junction resolvase RusA-like endonuclease